MIYTEFMLQLYKDVLLIKEEQKIIFYFKKISIYILKKLDSIILLVNNSVLFLSYWQNQK